MQGNNITNATLVSSTNLSGALTWTDLYSYPTQCGAGQIMYGVGDTLLCSFLAYSSLTGAPTTLSSFTDDLGARGYTVLSNFTDDLGNRGYTHLSNFTDDLGHVEDNTSWSEAYANTLYADISLVGDNTSWNQALADTLYADISVVDTDTNETTRVSNMINNPCTPGNFIANFSSTGVPGCDAPAGSGDITAVNTNGPYLTGGAASGDVSLLLDANAVFNGSAFNASFDAREQDLVTLAGTGTYLSIIGQQITVDPITESDISDLTHTTDTNANTICAGTTTYLDGEGLCDDLSSVYAPISVTGDNASWNETYADTLYLGISGNAATATALAANGANCAAGSYPLGVDASGAVESCTDATTEINSAISASGHLSNVVEDVTPQLGGNLDSQSKNITAISYAHFGTGCVYHNGSHIIIKGTC